MLQDLKLPYSKWIKNAKVKSVSRQIRVPVLQMSKLIGKQDYAYTLMSCDS